MTTERYIISAVIVAFSQLSNYDVTICKAHCG